MEKPDTVSDRIWAAWQSHSRKTRLRRGDECDFPEITKILMDKNCKCVWAALDRRFDTNKIERTFDAIHQHFFFGPSLEDLIPRSERAKIALNVNRTIAKLKTGLKKVNWRYGNVNLLFEGMPRIITEAVYDEAMLVATKAKEVYRKDFKGSVGKSLSEPPGESMFDFGTGIAAANIDQLLDGLVAGFNKWANSASPLASRGSKDPAMLTFIRGMTSTFRDIYGLPLRQPLAALVCCIFDRDIDAATVAKLAP